jgi:Cft2 family RNA processing exonuclease
VVGWIWLNSNIAVEEMLYDEQDLINTMDKIEPINYHQQIEANGIKFWCYNAGTYHHGAPTPRAIS